MVSNTVKGISFGSNSVIEMNLKLVRYFVFFYVYRKLAVLGEIQLTDSIVSVLNILHESEMQTSK